MFARCWGKKMLERVQSGTLSLSAAPLFDYWKTKTSRFHLHLLKAILKKKKEKMKRNYSMCGEKRECINLALNVLNDFSENGWCSVNSKNLIHLSRDRSCRLFSTSHRQPVTISPFLPAISPNMLSKWKEEKRKEEVFGFPSDQFVWAPMTSVHKQISLAYCTCQDKVYPGI